MKIKSADGGCEYTLFNIWLWFPIIYSGYYPVYSKERVCCVIYKTNKVSVPIQIKEGVYIRRKKLETGFILNYV